jgi:hypothetical protein
VSPVIRMPCPASIRSKAEKIITFRMGPPYLADFN